MVVIAKIVVAIDIVYSRAPPRGAAGCHISLVLRHTLKVWIIGTKKAANRPFGSIVVCWV
jgi:hypothetical protein